MRLRHFIPFILGISRTIADPEILVDICAENCNGCAQGEGSIRIDASEGGNELPSFFGRRFAKSVTTQPGTPGMVKVGTIEKDVSANNLIKLPYFLILYFSLPSRDEVTQKTAENITTGDFWLRADEEVKVFTLNKQILSMKSLFCQNTSDTAREAITDIINKSSLSELPTEVPGRVEQFKYYSRNHTLNFTESRRETNYVQEDMFWAEGQQDSSVKIDIISLQDTTTGCITLKPKDSVWKSEFRRSGKITGNKVEGHVTRKEFNAHSPVMGFAGRCEYAQDSLRRSRTRETKEVNIDIEYLVKLRPYDLSLMQLFVPARYSQKNEVNRTTFEDDGSKVISTTVWTHITTSQGSDGQWTSVKNTTTVVLTYKIYSKSRPVPVRGPPMEHTEEGKNGNGEFVKTTLEYPYDNPDFTEVHTISIIKETSTKIPYIPDEPSFPSLEQVNNTIKFKVAPMGTQITF